MKPADEDRLARYVEAGLAELDAGRTPDPAELCADAPELAAEVATLLGLEAALPDLGDRRRGRVDPLLGTVLRGRYRLEDRLGAGAMGTVYRAADLELRREVAVKLLAGGGFAGDTLQARFLREAEICAQLDHEHVVRIFDRGTAENGVLFLVMELLDGIPLSRVSGAETADPTAAYRDPEFLDRLCDGIARTERTALRQVVRWAAELAEGLVAVHARGVVHRDVKPSNAWVDRRGRAILLDFGIAARPEDAALTRAGSHVGTPWYMAPEIARGEAASPATDVYGLGASLYHLLASRPPFEGAPAAVLHAVQEQDPPRLASLHPQLPRDLTAVVEQAMAREPRHRHGDAAALAGDLRAFLEHRPVSARPLGPVRRTWRRIRRRPARAVAVAAVLLALIGFGIAMPLWSGWQADTDAREHQRRLGRLPALLTIEGWPAQRMLVGDDERGAQLDELGGLLQLAPDDHATRALRAAIHLDLGDKAAAAADLAHIASATGSTYLEELARRYRSLPPAARGVAALDLSAMPTPDRPVDHFLAGLHAMRAHSQEGFEQAVDHLGRAVGWPPARDLRLIALLGTEAPAAVEEALAEARDLESLYGRPTARTRHTIGAALLHLRRYDEAIPVLRDAVALRDDRHGPHNNLGLALLRTGRLAEAREELLTAHRIRPWLHNTLELLSQLDADRGAFADAYAWAEQIEAPDRSGASIWNRPYAVASVAVKEAAAAVLAGDDEQARHSAERAQASFTAALQLEPPRRYAGAARLMIPFLEGLGAGAPERGFGGLVSPLLADPLDPAGLRNLAASLPVEFSSDHVAVFRTLLLEMAAALAPGSERFRTDADDHRERLGLPRKHPRSDGTPASETSSTTGRRER